MINALITYSPTKKLNIVPGEINFYSNLRVPKKDRVENVSSEILFITSYPPRECGIATYSEDLINALNNQYTNTFEYSICALESDSEQHIYKSPPKFKLNTNQKNAFAKTAFLINRDIAIKLVIIQHEFGFFNEHDEDFKQFYEAISKPIIFVFHTVLPKPNYITLRKVNQMITAAESVVVMTKNAANLLIQDYEIPQNKITIIPHGTHLVPALKKEDLKDTYHFTGRQILSTFGLLNAGKGIEITLEALPAIIQVHPNVLFLILGKTHPTVVKNEGEIYRKMLEDKVATLNLGDYVLFLNEYLPLPKLLDYLQLTDIYLFTSKDPFQAVSGTFAYAMSCGCPIISTPIPFAQEFITDDTGRLIDFDRPDQLSKAVNYLLSDDKLRMKLSLNCLQKMAVTSWGNSAIAHGQLFNKLNKDKQKPIFKKPTFSLNHFNKMTTDIGFVQFSNGAIPDLNSGYTLDDNARALIVACQHFQQTKNPQDLEKINVYFMFIRYCFQPNGTFLNYVNDDNEFTKQNTIENIEDSTGRAIWALGYMLSLEDYLPTRVFSMAENIIQDAMPNLLLINSSRAMAFIIKGLHFQNKTENLSYMKVFANRLLQMYRHEREGDWHWFESYLTYANSVLPEAMLCAYLSLDDDQYRKVAKESFDFLLGIIFVNGHIKIISNKGWHFKNEENVPQIGGEQAIDIAYTILALEKFSHEFPLSNYKSKAEIAFNWFLGDNHLNQNVYNHCTGGCYDGIEEFNININQGAESTLSFLLSRLAMERMFHSKTISLQMQLAVEFIK
ncbi:MAG TPA: glycosyltransferase [Saprospiraceae bacterium]|nr:glycosyltransferase [Saprospiraceae bacterium]HPN67954.1 glycosyltransferase [Saprospiraceae bacterium]